MEANTSADVVCNQTEAWSWVYIMQPAFMSIICFLGVLGNSFVLVVFCLEKHRSSVADIYLSNLALADLLMVSCLPFWVATIVNEFHWSFGEPMCQIINVIIGINYYCSVLFITLVSVDRYLVLTRPLSQGRNRGACRARMICFCIWTTGVLLSFPAIIFRSVQFLPDLGIKVCYLDYPHDGWRLRYNFTVIVVGFVIPVPIVSYTSYHIIKVLRSSRRTRNNNSHGMERKAAILVLTVLIVFIICWLPYQTFIFLDSLDHYNIISGCTWAHILDIGEQLTTYIGYSNSFLNPFLYVFVGKHFKQRAKKVFQAVFRIQRKWKRGKSGHSYVTSRQYESTTI